MSENTMHKLDRININDEDIFFNKYLGKSPVLLDINKFNWPILSKWDDLYFEQNYGNLLLKVRQIDNIENKIQVVRMSLKSYLKYREELSADSKQCINKSKFYYLADWEITSSNLSLINDFKVPEIFAHDVLDQFPPPLRFGRQWIFIGHQHVGTPLHKDTFSTCAWLVMVQGTKQIRIFNDRNINLDTSVSLFNETGVSILETNDVFEAIIKPGEILYIPGNWYHEVKNLDNNIMLTGNFLSKNNVVSCLNQMEQRYNEPLKLINELKVQFST